MKKATLALVLVAASALPAFAADVTSLAVSGSNPRPQVATSSTTGGVVQAVLTYFGF